MATRTDSTYREGDLIRVTNKETDEGFQARARKCPDPTRTDYDGTLFLSDNWDQDWRKWTFLEWWGNYSKEQYTVQLVDRAPEPVTLGPGWYKDQDADLWWLDPDGKWYFNENKDPIEAVVVYPTTADAVLTRLYTKEDVIKLVHVVAWDADPDYVYGGPALRLIEKLEASL